MEAAGRGCGEIVSLMIDQGVIHSRDRNGRTALHFACQRYRLNIVMMLLDAGADPQAKDDVSQLYAFLTYHRGVNVL